MTISILPTIKYSYLINKVLPVILLFSPLYLREKSFDLKFDDVWLFRVDPEQLHFENELFLTQKIQDEITSYFLSSKYKFLNYQYHIKKSCLYTFHRDLTSSQRFHKLKHPSYTLLIYLYEGELCSMCPNSKNSIITPTPVTINGKKGTCVLFNADIVHAAAYDSPPERECIQYKICHEDDIEKLQHLQGQIIKKESDTQGKWWGQLFLRYMSHKYVSLFDLNIFGKHIEKKTPSIITTFVEKHTNLSFYNGTKC